MKTHTLIFVVAFNLLALTTITFAQDVALGETLTISETFWTIQQTSSVGKMIARDTEGGLHLTWTWTPELNSGVRHVYYAFADDDNGDLAGQLEEVFPADNENRAGYTSLDLLQTQDGPVAILFFHGSSKGIAAMDFAPGFGAFSSTYFDPPGDVIPINVKGCIGREGRMFLAAGVHNPMAGDPNFQLTVWPADPWEDNNGWDVGERAEPEQITGLSYALTASRTSDKVAMVWHHNLIGVPADEDWAGRLEHQMNNDISAVIAEDGLVWDWNNPINVTKTILPDVEREGIAALGDTLRPHPDLDAIWVGDVLHVVFTTRGFWADLEGNLIPPVERLTVAESFIWHWDSESDTLTLVANGWFENDLDPGGFISNVCKPSLGADDDGRLYCVFTRMVPAGGDNQGYNYGDVYVSFSENGSEWSEAIVLTGTNPVEEGELEYIDETYPSLAERVDEYLHISYLLQAENDGEDHVASFEYHRVPTADLGDYVPVELPVENFQYHNRGELSVANNESRLPDKLTLCTVYPNPFNQITQISFSVGSPGDVRLSVFDVQGRNVEELLHSELKTGIHQISWRAEGLQSGVYVLRMEVDTRAISQKIILLR